MGNYVFGWSDPTSMYGNRMGAPVIFFYKRRMRWKPWRWEVYERSYNGLDFNVVVVKSNLTKLGAGGFIKLLQGE